MIHSQMQQQLQRAYLSYRFKIPVLIRNPTQANRYWYTLIDANEIATGARL